MQKNPRTERDIPANASTKAAAENEPESPPTTAAPFLSFFLVLSVLANIVLVSGCQTVHDFVYGDPCKYQKTSPEGPTGPNLPQRDDSALKDQLTTLAKLESVELGDKSNEVLARDIVKNLKKEKDHSEQLFKALLELDFDLGCEDAESSSEDALVKDLRERAKKLKKDYDEITKKTPVEVPVPFPDFERMEENLPLPQKKAMRAYHDFIKDLQGKRIIVISPED